MSLINLQSTFRISLACLLLSCSGIPGNASAETRGYVISLIHTATYASPDNCPEGGNGDNIEIDKRILQRLGYDQDEAIFILANDGVDRSGNKVDISKRGRMNGRVVDIHTYPTSVPDPEIETAKGRYAYGFNLNGVVEPASFENPETGETGIDNQMWRVLGCFDVYSVRRPVVPYNEGIAWDTAMDAMPAWLMSISGDDLDKDGEVTVTFDRSLNITMRNTQGGALRGASYTIDLDPRSHSRFKGRIENQVVTIEPGEFSMQGESQFYAVLRFSHTQLRLKLHSDGSLSGHIGGYQPWMDYFQYLAIRSESTAQVDIPGVFYAMRRLADARPDPVTGMNTQISAAYYMEAVPAFHVEAGGETVAWAYDGSPDSNFGAQSAADGEPSTDSTNAAAY